MKHHLSLVVVTGLSILNPVWVFAGASTGEARVEPEGDDSHLRNPRLVTCTQRTGAVCSRHGGALVQSALLVALGAMLVKGYQSVYPGIEALAEANANMQEGCAQAQHQCNDMAALFNATYSLCRKIFPLGS